MFGYEITEKPAFLQEEPINSESKIGRSNPSLVVAGRSIRNAAEVHRQLTCQYGFKILNQY